MLVRLQILDMIPIYDPYRGYGMSSQRRLAFSRGSVLEPVSRMAQYIMGICGLLN